MYPRERCRHWLVSAFLDINYVSMYPFTTGPLSLISCTIRFSSFDHHRTILTELRSCFLSDIDTKAAFSD